MNSTTEQLTSIYSILECVDENSLDSKARERLRERKERIMDLLMEGNKSKTDIISLINK